MNRRIRELSEHSTDQWLGGEFFDREKFAQLIVRECGNIAFDHWALTHDTSPQEAILKNFGVSE